MNREPRCKTCDKPQSLLWSGNVPYLVCTTPGCPRCPATKKKG